MAMNDEPSVQELRERLKETEDALRRAEDRFEIAQRIGKTGSWERNLDTGHVWWSDELYRMYGEDPATFDPTLENLLGRLHPEDRHIVEEDMWTAWANAKSYVADYRIILPDGTQRDMYSSLEIGCDEEGRSISMNGTAQDVTGSKALQRALEESQARAQALLDANPDLIFRISRDGEYLDYHANDESRLALPPDEIIGKNIAELFDENFAAEHQSHVKRALDTGEVQLWQYQLPIQGDNRNLEARIIRSGADEVIAIVQDITEQTRLEREVISIGTNERRRIGHDLHDGLGQELTAVSLALQTLSLKLSREDSPHAQAAQNLTVETQRMISEIRRFATQLSPVFSRDFGLNTALKALANEVEEYSNVRCQARCSYEDDTLDTDIAVHLYRIAQEGINNAVRHSAAKNIELRYGRDGDSLYLEVADDGTGIPSKENRVEGIGLRSMRYRARILRGRLEVGPRAQGGTRVLCSCPAPSA